MEEGGPGGREGGVMSNLKCKEDEVHMSNLVISLLARRPRVFVTWSEHHHPPPLKLWFRACVHNALLNYSSFPLACECVKRHALLIATYSALTTLFLKDAKLHLHYVYFTLTIPTFDTITPLLPLFSESFQSLLSVASLSTVSHFNFLFCSMY